MNLTDLHPSLWRAHQLGSASIECVPSGFSSLDAQLPGGGWPSRNLIELLIKHHGIGEMRFLMPCLRRLALEKKTIVFISPPFIPVPNVFEQYGVPTDRLILIQTPKPLDKLWATEQIIQSDSFGASVIWLPEKAGEKALPPNSLRRLQYHASRTSGLSFVFRPLIAQHNPSPATLRLILTAHSPESLRIQLLKRRGPVFDDPIYVDLPSPRAALPGLFSIPTETTEVEFNSTSSSEREHAMDRREHGLQSL